MRVLDMRAQMFDESTTRASLSRGWSFMVYHVIQHSLRFDNLSGLKR